MVGRICILSTVCLLVVVLACVQVTCIPSTAAITRGAANTRSPTSQYPQTSHVSKQDTDRSHPLDTDTYACAIVLCDGCDVCVQVCWR